MRVRRSLGVKDRRIRVFEGVKLLHVGITKCDTPASSNIAWATQESVEDRWQVKDREPLENQDLRSREFHRRMHFGIANPKTLTRGKVVVTE
jgi:hypothetical protein